MRHSTSAANLMACQGEAGQPQGVRQKTKRKSPLLRCAVRECGGQSRGRPGSAHILTLEAVTESGSWQRGIKIASQLTLRQRLSGSSEGPVPLL